MVKERKSYQGSVSISIEDFQKLLKSEENLNTIQENFTIAKKELQVFLSFIASKENIEKHIEEFNRQSQTSRILLDDGKVKIKMNND